MKKFLFGVFITLLLTSCEWISPEIEVPSYIEIPQYNFNAKAGEGSSSHNISDAWVFVNGQKIGAFELPAKFPVLDQGNCDIIIFAGIKLNGTAATRAAYTLYEAYKITTKLTPDSVTEILPSTTYAEGVNFSFIEDFESIGVIFEKTINSDTIINKTNNPENVFEGSYSGEITLTDTNPYVELKTIDSYELPQIGGTCFIELNFKGTAYLSVGVYANEGAYSTVHPIAVITPSTEWKKMYINLTPTISRLQKATSFNILIASQIQKEKTIENIWIDNIKLLY